MAVVRLCEEKTYAPEAFDGSAIELHAWPFADGDPPSDTIIDEWLKLVRETMARNKTKPAKDHFAIALHCVAGLGRSPVMAAIALIENGLDWQQAVDLIRKNRYVESPPSC